MLEKLVDGGESVNVNMHIQSKVLKWHIHLWISGLKAVFMSFATMTQPLKSNSYLIELIRIHPKIMINRD